MLMADSLPTKSEQSFTQKATEKKITCLLVEDNEIDSKLIEAMLSSEEISSKIELIKTNSLSDGIQFLFDKDIDVVLLDLDLPDSSGMKSIQKFTKVTVAIPIIIVTSMDDEKIALEAVRCGVQDYLVKGKFDEHVLCRAIEYAIERKKNQGRLSNFQDFADAAGYGFVLTDVNGRIVYVNDSFVHSVDAKAPNMVVGGMFFDYFPKDQMAKFNDEIWPLIQKNGQWFGEIELMSQQSRVIHAIQNIIVVNDKKGNPLYFGSVIIDVSPLKEEGKRLEASERKHRELFEKMVAGIAVHQIIVDDSGKPVDYEFLDVNPAFEKLTGLKREKVIGRRVTNIIPGIKDSKFDWISRYGETALTGKTHRFDEYSEAIDKWFSVLSYSTQEGQFVTLFSDITERKRMELAIVESEKKYRDLFQHTSDGIVVTDVDGLILDANVAYVNMLGFEKMSEIRGRSFLEFTAEKWNRANPRQYWSEELFEKGYTQPFEKEYVKKDGSIVPVEIRGYMIRGEDGEVSRLWSFVRDISDKKQHDDQYQKAMFYDQLTMLPNRLLAMDRFSQVIARARREDCLAAFMIIDLDQFKIVNDTLGHHFGDRLLVDVAKKLREAVRMSDTVARLGGDEYLIILPDIENVDRVAGVAQKVLEAFAEPFDLDGREVFVTASIGIAIYPNDGCELETLLKNADTAMYKSKDSSRNNFAFFSPEMNKKASQRLVVETRLKHALEENAFLLHYQPIYEIKSRKLVGAEVLIRWHDSELGFVMPDQFIHLAEETGDIVPIGEWVLRTACYQARKWQQWYEFPFRILVNVSSRQFERCDVPEIVDQILRETGLSASSLELEVTEGILLGNQLHVQNMMNTLSSRGVTLSVDDFGTGYSALSYLKSFAFSTVKMDRSFIKEITTDSKDRLLASAIIAMSHGLKLQVVGEGIETEEQLEILKFQGCDLAQGFYFSRPIPADQFEKNIKLTY